MTFHYRKILLLVYVVLALALSGCEPVEKTLEPGTAPEANAGPDQFVDEQALATLDGSGSLRAEGATISYQWSQVSGTPVYVTGLSAPVASFDAHPVSEPEALIFQLKVTDDTGKSDTDNVSVTVNPVSGLNDYPEANAGPDQSVAPERVVQLDGSNSIDYDGSIATYQWTQLSGISVTIDAADMAVASFTGPLLTGALVFELLVTDNEGATGLDLVTVTVAPLVSVTGTVTYDRVPHSPTGGLDYAATVSLPVRGAVVQAVSAVGGIVLAMGVTDAAGDYVLDVDTGNDMFVRVVAELKRSGAPSWHYRVVDNTRTDQLYTLDGPVFNSGLGSAGRNLHADSGWDGSSYATVRAAAPFAILDTVYTSTELILSVEPDAFFPPLDLHWSNANIAAGGETLEQVLRGEIGSTRYFPSFAGGGIFVLGVEDFDTDEYDAHVIAHEWAHYFEFTFSRSDSIGGQHFFGGQLDLRLAFGEGYANAMSAIILDDSVYRDSLGPGQASSFDFDIEESSGLNPGWYSEESVHAIFYDLYDTDADGLDNIGLGFGPLYSVLVNQQRVTTALTSIFSFIDALKIDQPGEAAAIDVLLSGQEISPVADKYGTGEVNAGNPSSTDVLPVYSTLLVDSVAVNVCSITDFQSGSLGAYNDLGARQFLSLAVANPATYQISAMATLSPGGVPANPDIILHQRGEVFRADSSDLDTEIFDIDLVPGEYVLEVYERQNIGEGTLGRTCFNVEIDQL